MIILFLLFSFYLNIFEKVFDLIVNYQKGHFRETEFDRADYSSFQDNSNLMYTWEFNSYDN